MATVHDFKLEKLRGGELPLSEFHGKPLIIVNTASKCGFTPQYAGLETLYKEYKDDGLAILGVPCNQFGKQEPGGADEISEFCQINYGVSFPMAAKIDVKGGSAHPLYKHMTREAGIFSTPRWNFYKFLVTRDGKVQDWFGSITAPDSAKFRKAVEKLVKG